MNNNIIYNFSGIIIEGQKLGRTLGYPTANIKIKDPLPIKQGVYLVKIKIPNLNKKDYWGMADYWTNPKTGLTFETHIFDFDQNIYGEILEIEVVYFYRENFNIKNLEELKIQLNKDADALKKIILKL